MTNSVDEGRAVYLGVSKTFNAVSNNILMDRWRKHILYKRTVRWIKN